jgi:hypothetical protein
MRHGRAADVNHLSRLRQLPEVSARATRGRHWAVLSPLLAEPETLTPTSNASTCVRLCGSGGSLADTPRSASAWGQMKGGTGGMHLHSNGVVWHSPVSYGYHDI